MHYIIYKSIIN